MADILTSIGNKQHQGIQQLESYFQGGDNNSYHDSLFDLFMDNIGNCFDRITKKYYGGFEQLGTHFEEEDQTKLSNVTDRALKNIGGKIGVGIQDFQEGIQRYQLCTEEREDYEPVQWRQKLEKQQQRNIVDKEDINTPANTNNIIQQNHQQVASQNSKNILIARENKIEPNKQTQKSQNNDKTSNFEHKQQTNNQQHLVYQKQQNLGENNKEEQQFDENIPMTDKPTHKKTAHEKKQEPQQRNSEVIHRKKNNNIYRINKDSTRRQSVVKQKQAEQIMRANIDFLQGLKGLGKGSTTNLKNNQWKNQGAGSRKNTTLDALKQERKKKMQNLGFSNAKTDEKMNQSLMQNTQQFMEMLPKIRKQRQQGHIFKPVPFTIYSISQKQGEVFTNPQNA